jgi:hypothetical protein
MENIFLPLTWVTFLESAQKSLCVLLLSCGPYCVNKDKLMDHNIIYSSVSQNGVPVPFGVLNLLIRGTVSSNFRYSNRQLMSFDVLFFSN